jgi:uncharacterized protein (DUF433 family)
VNPKIFSGKPIIRGRRLAVEHVLAMSAAGDTSETILEGYPWKVIMKSIKQLTYDDLENLIEQKVLEILGDSDIN